MVKLLGESSIGQGVRRVEALVGADAYRFLAREHVLVAQLTEALKVRPEELPERVASILDQLREANKEIERMRQGRLLAAAPALAQQAHDVFGVAYVGHHVSDGGGADAADFLDFADFAIAAPIRTQTSGYGRARAGEMLAALVLQFVMPGLDPGIQGCRNAAGHGNPGSPDQVRR